MKKIFIAILAVATLSFTSCNKWLDVNDNPNYPTEVSVASLLPTIEMYTAEKVGYELNLVGSFWSQYVNQYGSSNQYYTIMTYNLANSASYFTSPWQYIYGRILPNLKIMLTNAQEAGMSNYVLYGNTLLAYNLYLLTSLYDKVAFSKAYMTQNYLSTGADFNPEFDSAADIYKTICDYLDGIYQDSINEDSHDSIAADAESFSAASSDMIFDGDIDSWFAFANTLYLKVLLRDFANNQDKIKDVLANAKFLKVDAAFDHYLDEADKSNPLYESDRRQLNTAQNIRCCDDITGNVNCAGVLSSDDPRLAVYYEKGVKGTPYGTTKTGTANTNRLALSATAPVYFSTAEEASFLVAEAKARLGEDATADYTAALNASFDRNGVDGTALIGGDYAFDSTASIEGQIEQIINQKWAANVNGMPIEAWFDINRTGYPARGTSITDYKGVLGGYPVRFLYPQASALYNTNSPANVDDVKLTTPMWWHKQ